MAYKKQVFQAGTVLKAEQLNYMEDGIAQMSEKLDDVQENISLSATDDGVGNVTINVTSA